MFLLPFAGFLVEPILPNEANRNANLFIPSSTRVLIRCFGVPVTEKSMVALARAMKAVVTA